MTSSGPWPRLLPISGRGPARDRSAEPHPGLAIAARRFGPPGCVRSPGARRLPRRGVHLRLVGAPAGGSAPRLMLYVVRHGETAPNAAGLLLGRSDPRLTERGRTQAAGLAATLPAPDRVVSSPLRRARETAAAFGRTVEVDDRWIELDYGRLEGTDPASVPTEVWAQWRANPDYAPGGGEPLSALGVRA